MQFPGPAWMDVFWRVKDEISNDRVMIVAGGVTFFAILSLVPMVTAFVAVFGLFADTSSVASLVRGMQGAVPQEALTLIQAQLDRLVTTASSTLSTTSFLALAIAFYTANGGVKGLIAAMNIAYEEEETRGFIALNLWSMVLTLSAMLLVATLIVAAALLPALTALVPSSAMLDAVLLYGRWPVMALVLVFALSVLYRFGPDRREAKWRWVTPGSIFAAMGLMLASVAFALYTSSFAAYNEIYGSLGTIVAVMVWLWIGSIVVIVGAEINAELEHQTAQDTTIGQDRPMGSRGAVMADKVSPRRK
ncbi:MAG: YihY/virulence factor BrkB family protein [Gemmobacter sp.]